MAGGEFRAPDVLNSRNLIEGNERKENRIREQIDGEQRSTIDDGIKDNKFQQKKFYLFLVVLVIKPSFNLISFLVELKNLLDYQNYYYFVTFYT